MADTPTPTKENKTTSTADAKPREFKKNHRKRRRNSNRNERQKPEFEQKIVSIRRVTRVMSGGRRFSFSVGMVAGDGKGRVGFGAGKAGDTTLAIEKAYRQAKKNMLTIERTETNSIPHDVQAKYTASEIVIWPRPGRGLTAGSSVRDVLQLAGITDVSAKILSRSKNQVNTVKATIKALKQLVPAKKKTGSIIKQSDKKSPAKA